eukprot:CAMPEP_0206401106 /NCGR_PEP_ID=MMETSP0294-20121207/26018_1 /ASSEMBLY_ACC=CAM_ASM_000327 /TAXON_ID=39354 /ORGANISM="Heterosigma akashiwo, Strain CCMP2393" /LENGTH=77 /DNA_ID=CAMNT_0053857635 /DNA_START=654 /DNA_END=888 /DNA_ORIENTATION=+
MATGEDGEPRPGQGHGGLGQPLRPQQTLHAPDVPQVLQAEANTAVTGASRTRRLLEAPSMASASALFVSSDLTRTIT